MKYFYLILLTVFFYTSPVLAENLLRLPLDDKSKIGVSIERDTKVKVEGSASLRITTKWPVTINLGELSGAEFAASLITYRAKLKSKDLNGRAYLEMWSLFADGGEFFSRGFETGVQVKNSDWVDASTPFTFKPGILPTTLTLNLVIQGAGTVWVDDVRLEKQPLK